MAQLVYTITGNNAGLATAVNNSIGLIGKLQTALDKINATSFAGLTASLQGLSTALSSTAAGGQILNTTLQNGRTAAANFQAGLAGLNTNGVAPLSAGILGLRTNVVGLNQSLNSSGGGGSGFGGVGLFAGLISGYTALFAAITIVKKVVSSNAEISDSLADVRRTASLTAQETDRLFNSLEKINTRTSLKGLIDISTIGGQLGIAKDQLAGFTRATDLLNVALGGEIKGGPEEIAKGLGILNNVFKISDREGGNVEKAFNQIGSTILGLGQSGLATGDFLVKFGEKVGGVAAQAKLSLPTLLSYGAVLQEQGVTAEVAGTAFKKLLAGLATRAPKFLAVAQIADSSLTLSQFNNLINTDTQAALELFFAGLRKGGPTTTTFLSLLKSVGLDAARSGQAISAISLNMDSLHKHFEQSIIDFDAASKAAAQAALKNDTLGASIDKLVNTFTKATTSGEIGQFFKTIIDGATAAIKAIAGLGTKVTGFIHPTQSILRSDAVSKTAAANDISDSFTASKTQVASITDRFSQNPQVLLKNLAVLKSAYGEAYHAYSVYFDNIKAGRVKESQNAGETLNDVRKNAEDILQVYNNVNKRLSIVGPPPKPGEGVTLPGKEKKASASGISQDDFLNRLQTFNDGVTSDQSGLIGLDATLQKIEAKYKLHFDRLNALRIQLDKSNKITDKQRVSDETALTDEENTLLTDKAKELSDARVKEAQRVTSEVQRINDEFGIKAEQSRGRELAAIQARYDAEVRKAKGNADILRAIEAGKLNAIQQVNDKYQKIQDDLYFRIGEIEDLAISATKVKLESETDRIVIEWEKRRKAADDYYNNLKKIAASNPNNPADVLPGLTNAFANLNLKRQQNATGGIIDRGESASVVKAQVKDFTDTLSGGLVDASKNALSFFTTLNQQTDRSFGAIFSGLVANINASFANIFENILAKGLTTSLTDSITQAAIAGQVSLTTNLQDGIVKGTAGLSGALSSRLIAGIAAAGLAGSLISGATSKTSVVGQGLGGALSGAATGALVGSALFPGGGTLVGGLIGGAIGLLGGIFGASKAQKEKQAEQLAEAKQQTALLRQSIAYTSTVIGRMTASGLISDLSVGATGQLVATVSGKQLQFILDRNGR